MCTSDDRHFRTGKLARRWLAASLFCGFFSAVYEHFSHGVYSSFMIWLFLFPLILGVLPFAAVRLLHLPTPAHFAENSYDLGVVTLTVGSCLTGVFEIYGAPSEYVRWYWIVGSALAAVGLAAYLMGNGRSKI